MKKDLIGTSVSPADLCVCNDGIVSSISVFVAGYRDMFSPFLFLSTYGNLFLPL